MSRRIALFTPVFTDHDAIGEIERRVFSFTDVLAMVLNGRMVDSMTIIAVQRVGLTMAC